MASFIVRRSEDSLQKQPEPLIARARCISYEKHLTNMGVHPQDYDKVYELAVQIYNETSIQGPFGIDYIIQGVRRFTEKKVKPVVFKLEKVERHDCSFCNGTGIKFDSLGKIVYEEVNGKKKVQKCEECVSES